MTMIARVLSNPVVAKVEGIDDSTKLALSDAMSFIVEGYEHMPNAGGWDGKSTLFDWPTAKFPAGFIPTAHAVLSQRGYTVQSIKHPLPAPQGPLPTPDAPVVDNFARDDRYDYQFRAVSILEKHGSFIARVATGGGKSRIARLCIARVGRKTMFITTRQVLLYQFGEACEASGMKVSYIGDGQWDTSGDVVCAMVHTLAGRLGDANTEGLTNLQEINAVRQRHEDRRKEATDFLDTIEFVIGEEAHEAGGTGYFDVLKSCRKAAYRLGLTATPMMRDGESNVRLVAMFGPIRLEISEKMLIDRGILARPIFKYRKAPCPPLLRRGTAWQKAEEIGIIENHDRNKWVCAEAIRASRWGLPVLVLIKRQKHGKILATMLASQGIRAVFIYGESNKKKRDQALADLKAGRIDVLIGSTILDVGVDVPAIGMLILAGGGKAEVATRQRIGRGLRAKAEGPNVCLVVDFDDGHNKHLIKHARQRRAIVEETAGFAENILSTKDDFDFVGLGYSRPMTKAA